MADPPIARSPDAWSLSIYVCSRLISLAILMLAADALYSRHMAAGGPFHLWHEALDRWDAYFYRTIATTGYPRTLPANAAGEVVANEWAFFPAFPFAARAVGWLTRLNFDAAAVIVNLAAGALAAVFIGRLSQRICGQRVHVRAVALWSFFPTSFVLNVPYAEAIYLAIAAGFLLALVERRLVVAGLCLAAAGLSRGYTIPLSAAALVVCWDVWRGRPAGSDGAGTGAGAASRASAAALASAAILAPFIWPFVAGLVTGRPDAYTATQHVWGYSLNPTETLAQWRDILPAITSRGFPWMATISLGAVVAVALLALPLRLPREITIYTLTAAAFLVAIAQPEAVGYASTPRFAFAIVTLPIVLAIHLKRPIAMGTALVTVTALQYWWVFDIWSGRLGVAP